MPDTAAGGAAPPAPRRHLRSAVRYLAVAVIGLAVARPSWLAPNDPTALDLDTTLRGPSWATPFGTDGFGRCVMSRLIHGARPTIVPALVIALSCCAVASFAGVLLAANRRRVREWGGAVVGIVVSVPSLLLAVAATAIDGPGTITAAVMLGLTGWAAPSTILGQIVRRELASGHVIATTAMGGGVGWVLRHHVAPAVIGRLGVVGSNIFVSSMLTLSGLSVLGLGPQPPSAEWGAMLNEGRQWFFASPALILAPALTIAAVALVAAGAADRVVLRTDGAGLS